MGAKKNRRIFRRVNGGGAVLQYTNIHGYRGKARFHDYKTRHAGHNNSPRYVAALPESEHTLFMQQPAHKAHQRHGQHDGEPEKLAEGQALHIHAVEAGDNIRNRNNNRY